MTDVFKRLFFTVLGLGAGVAIGVRAVQKVESAQRALRPDVLAASAGARAGSLTGRLRTAVEEGRRAAVDRESELRAVYRVGEAPDIAPPRTPPP